MKGDPSLAIFGDWDADGIISSSVIMNAQRHGMIYPIRGKAIIEYEPAEPVYLSIRLMEIGCFNAIAILDIPIIDRLLESLRSYRARCPSSMIIYIDHHISTHEKIEDLYGLVEEPLVGYVPASRIAFDRVVSLGYRPSDRLKLFVDAVDLMDRGVRVPENMRGLLKIVSSISKALSYKRDPALWRSAVDWISSPVPLSSTIAGASMEEIARLAAESDKRIRDEANMLAISAQKLGIFRYIDARRKWMDRGASALASMLYRKLRAPVILSVASRDRRHVLMIIKYPGKAYRVVKMLMEAGIAESIGGHSSLGIARIPANRISDALEMLRSSAIY